MGLPLVLCIDESAAAAGEDDLFGGSSSASGAERGRGAFFINHQLGHYPRLDSGSLTLAIREQSRAVARRTLFGRGLPAAARRPSSRALGFRLGGREGGFLGSF